MKQLFSILICLGSIFLSFSYALGEVRTFTKEYTYKSGPLDNEFSSQVIAKAYVKNMILDSMGTRAKGLLEKWGYPYNAEYTKAMMSCMSKVKVAKEKWENRDYYYKARTRSNVTSILTDFGTISEKEIPTGDILANHAIANEALKEIERINGNLAASPEEAGKQEAYDLAVNNLHAADWYERARFAGFSGEDDSAIDAYAKVIEHNPKFAAAYQQRGQLYINHLKDTNKGLADLSTAMQLYYSSAMGQQRLKEYQTCVGSLDAVLRISSKDPDVYYLRAVCNVGLKQQDKAKEDFKEAAKLGHKKARELLTAKGMEW